MYYLTKIKPNNMALGWLKVFTFIRLPNDSYQKER